MNSNQNTASLTQHPDSGWLAEYNAGNLPLAHEICVSTHLNYCKECRETLASFTAVGASIMNNAPEMSVNDDLFSKTLDAIDSRPLAKPAKKQSSLEGYPSVINKLIQGNLEDLDWKTVTKKLKVCRLKTGDTEREVALYHISAGGKIPSHRHTGKEITVLLKGSFSDNKGLYNKGDFLLREDNDSHSPTATMDGDCICLGVLESPIQFDKGWTRLLNPLLKIQPA